MEEAKRRFNRILFIERANESQLAIIALIYNSTRAISRTFRAFDKAEKVLQNMGTNGLDRKIK